MTQKTVKSDKVKSVERLSVGQTIDLTVSRMNDDGYCLAVHGTMPVLVSGALPSEMVRVRVTFAGRREAHAEVVKVLRHSPARLVASTCAALKNCAGCQLICMNYPAQLSWKREIIAGHLGRYPTLKETRLNDVLPSPSPLGYRTSAKLVMDGTFTDPVIGIYRRNSHEVIDISDCPLHHPLINTIVRAVKTGIRKGRVPIFHARSGAGLLRYLVVRVAADGSSAMVVFVTARRSYNEIHHLAKHLQAQVPEVRVMVQNVNSSEGNVILGQKDFFLTNERVLPITVGAVRFAVSPRSFFQVNIEAARHLYEQVREWAELSGKERVVDLYCGVGGISLFLSAGAQEVYGIEVVESAVADAETNARLNGITNCRFDAGDAGELLQEYAEEGLKADVLVLNPPRKGCEPAVLERIADVMPARIIYVSCSPQTLARDLDILAAKGFRTVAVQPVDMFPQTPHVETVALLVSTAGK
jgi:23S rRNA (uracil1939-C5)-methyltransferase